METIGFSAKPVETIGFSAKLKKLVRKETKFIKEEVLPQKLDLHAGTLTPLHAGTGAVTPSL